MKKLSILFFSFLNTILIGQPPYKFHSNFGGNGYDVGYDVKQTLDNGYIITGSTSSFGQGNTDLYLLKLDSMGQKKFETSFGGYNNEIGKSIVQLSDSSYVMAGYTSSIGVGGYDVFLVKADKNGNLMWQKTIGGSDWDFAYSMDTTADGGFIISGTTYSFGHGNADGYIVKTDANGDVIWSKTYGGLKDDEFKSIIQTSDGNFALAGSTKSYNDSLGDAWVFKVDVNGDSLWSKYFGGNKEDFLNQIIENKNSDYIIAGATNSFGAGLLDGYALRINNTGTAIATLVNGTATFDEIYTSVALSRRNSGNRLCLSQKELFVGYKFQIKLIEFDFDLNYLAASDHGSVNYDETYKLIPTQDKGYAAIGYTNGFSSILTDCYLIKIDSTIIGGPHVVSIRDIDKNNIQFKIYPNPAEHFITIQSNNVIEENLIKLYYITAQEIYLKDKISFISKQTAQLNLQEILPGVYYLKYNNTIQKITIIH